MAYLGTADVAHLNRILEETDFTVADLVNYIWSVGITDVSNLDLIGAAYHMVLQYADSEFPRMKLTDHIDVWENYLDTGYRPDKTAEIRLKILANKLKNSEDNALKWFISEFDL